MMVFGYMKPTKQHPNWGVLVELIFVSEKFFPGHVSLIQGHIGLCKDLLTWHPLEKYVAPRWWTPAP